MAKLFGKESQVNSVHRQSIKDLAPNFRVTAIDSRDQTIEAMSLSTSTALSVYSGIQSFWLMKKMAI